MECPSCQNEIPRDAVACSACGRSLLKEGARQQTPRPASKRRRRNENANDGGADNDQDNPAARRAFHLSLLAFLPGAGLLLGPAAILLGSRAVRGCSGDFSRHRAKAAVLFGIVITFTQWLGVALMIYGWRR